MAYPSLSQVNAAILRSQLDEIESQSKKEYRPRVKRSTSINALSIRLARMRQRGEDVTHSQTFRDYLDALNHKHTKDKV